VAVQFTYGNDPSQSPEDAVRFYLGDTNKSRPLLDDREIGFALTEKGGNEKLAAAVCADALQGKFASLADTRVGDVSKSFGQISKAYKELAKTLRSEAFLKAAPRAPAIFRSDKRALEQNTALTKPEFSLGQGDNPWAIQMNDDLDRARFNGF
jgi:hypothetical protein